jgi:hypothetical protein
MALCGTLQPDGTIAVKLSWTAGTPDPSSEIVAYRCMSPIPSGTQHVDLLGPISPGTYREVIVSNLLPGSSYAWTVYTYFPDGSHLASDGKTFETPSEAKMPATNLVCSS